MLLISDTSLPNLALWKSHACPHFSRVHCAIEECPEHDVDEEASEETACKEKSK